MFGYRSALLCISISFIVAVHGKHEPESELNGRVLGGKASGNLFGFLSVKTCRETSPGVFETTSTSRLAVLFGSGDSTGTKGACNDLCKTLCPTTCYGSSKVDGSKCTCSAFKCSGNAFCKDNKQCSCKLGFAGNGLTCCDASVPGCAPAPSAPSAPSVPSAPTPTGTPPSAPRPPVVGADVFPPKLLNIAISQTVVDVTTGNKTVTVDFEVQDRSGFRTPEIYLTDGSFVLYSGAERRNYSTSLPVKFSYIFNVSIYAPAGELGMNFRVADLSKFFNELRLQANDLAELNFPYSVEIVNPRSEKAPPELLKINPITPLPVSTVALRTTGFLLGIVAQDDFSGLRRASLQLTNITIYGRAYSYDINFDPPIAGVPVTGTFNFTDSWQVGTYDLAIILEDNARKTSVYNGTQLVNLGWTSVFRVVA